MLLELVMSDFELHFFHPIQKAVLLQRGRDQQVGS